MAEIYLQTSAAYIFPVLPGDLTIQAFKIFRWKYPKWSKNGFDNLKHEKVIQERKFLNSPIIRYDLSRVGQSQ